ncbi:RNA-binding protein Mrn1p [[Candida] jaroonii]|uniref:RNA-binding protein Mrn1p n=1 Tax=[Candida] jaroonii TaxID=467808 RepID=A0ACA9Y522_9ASCO|nr:RNA-binding protein Mrn1p [[Candida] jaroonii]
MSYYGPYQGMPQQYIQGYYYQESNENLHLNNGGYDLYRDPHYINSDDQPSNSQNSNNQSSSGGPDSLSPNGNEFYGDDGSYLSSNGMSSNLNHLMYPPPINNQSQFDQYYHNPSQILDLSSLSNELSQINSDPSMHQLSLPTNTSSLSQFNNLNLSNNHIPSPITNNSNSVAPSRTVYLGNIPNDIEPHELLDYVRSGILENVKILPSKNCAFISFIDHQSALLFHSDCILKKLNIKGHDIKIGWGKDSPILPAVLESIQRDGATRNVYLGNLNNPITGNLITENELRDDLSCYGIIDSIKIIPDKGIAFIHFLSILSAIRCVGNLPLKEKYLGKKCFYGKDRCAFITKTQQHNAAQYLGLAPGMEHIVTAADREFISSALVQQSAAAAQIATHAGGANNLGNRTVYLGNLHQDSSVEEICNVVRGGLLQSIRYLKERHVCFITFIDPIAAAQFFAMCQLHGLTIHNRRIKVGWGKHSGPLSNALSLAVSNGASRNIYVGNINDFNYYNQDKLRQDFSTFGDIEQINYLQEKNCAFINFINISNAIKAIDGIKSFNDYKDLKINFGKDRCGNLPRQFQQQQQQNHQHPHNHHQNDDKSLKSPQHSSEPENS